ncbi:MAG TPA: amidase [Acidimicrobiia bacterium]|nr:amidase [Acidimicrobiia bacterium]
MTDLAALDATAQAELVRSGDASAAELVDAAIERIEKLNGELNAVVIPLYERARAAVQRGLPAGPFQGVPIVIKDLDGTLAGVPYHGGMRLLKERDYVPEVTSFLFEKLEAAGFVIVGKTNTPEFGLMTTTEPESYGPAHNPWDVSRSTGGSSGGSGAAVASGMVPVGHAGDGGGSIRVPASHNGIFGLKPNRARVSLGPDEMEAWAGLVQRHVVTRTVRDSAGVLDILHGYMTGDFYSTPPPGRAYAREAATDPGSLRIGIRVTAPLGLAEVDPECVTAAENAGRLLESLGHNVEIATPAALDEIAMMASFLTVMNSALRADVLALGEKIGHEITAADVEAGTWSNFEAAAEIDAAAYVRGIADMHRWTRAAVSWWDDYDILLTPVCAEPPPELGDLIRPETNGSRLLPFAIFTAPFNVTGQPAMSVPLHWTASGLPVGVQMVAAPYREDVLFRLAGQLEQAQPWADRRPPVFA